VTDLSNAFPMARIVLERAQSAPKMNEIGLQASREAARKRTTTPPFEDVASLVDATATGPGTAVPLRVYRPASASSAGAPVIMFFHAGGWILGDLDHSDNLCRHLANVSAAVVVSVDYRLSPETKFPGPLDDCENALRWVVAQHLTLGIDPDRIILLGESSGGNLAAALALRNVRLKFANIRHILLLTPALDASMGTPSWSELGEICIPARQQMAWMWDCYTVSADLADPEANPAVAQNFSNHPAATIVSAGFDPLKDEARLYAEKLGAEGVEVAYRCEERLLHAFSNMGGLVPEGLEAFDRAVRDVMGSPALAAA